MDKRTRRVFTPEQKFAMLQDIETCPTVREGLKKHQLCHSVYQKWKRHWRWAFEPPFGTTSPARLRISGHLEAKNKKLKEVVLMQSMVISE